MWGLQNGHAMTILATFWPRSFAQVIDNQLTRFVKVDEESTVLVEINLAQKASSHAGISKHAVIVLHGLEGSSRSHYLLGLSQKLVAAGVSVFRMNMRNCGGTLHLTPTLYNAGLSSDLNVVCEELVSEYELESLFLIGFSLGGNVVLKSAAELGLNNPPWLKGVCAISPSIDLHSCVSAIERGFNRLYELNFLRGLKQKIIEKHKLYPHRYDLSKLSGIKGIRDFDNSYTAPDGGYKSADDYYTRASSLHLLEKVQVPILMIAAKNDPIVPFESFECDAMKRRGITLMAPLCGGHAGFVSFDGLVDDITFGDRFWAENQVVRFCLENLS